MNEREEVQAKFKGISEELGTCPAFKVFTLGANGTCYVGCGLPPEHWSNIDGQPGVTYPQHQAVQTDEDGARVVFQWPVT